MTFATPSRVSIVRRAATWTVNAVGSTATPAGDGDRERQVPSAGTLKVWLTSPSCGVAAPTACGAAMVTNPVVLHAAMAASAATRPLRRSGLTAGPARRRESVGKSVEAHALVQPERGVVRGGCVHQHSLHPPASQPAQRVVHQGQPQPFTPVVGMHGEALQEARRLSRPVMA